ncbi:hypothetical protein pthi1_p44 [Paracoccus phage vB_PthS_Pthi1]|uniref:Uncharacterized protein n=1 Tax=Paracoccus thiocyanatus TaxID=34006 RepID=A0A1N6SEH4_9RHOB|nr:hypothetical protein [Paracoccus thiocyanatus]AZV00409.1 hypothetical protein pthi1_p44 [Paracoccus phage vB_PthS_Pthi1]SIQ39429.1 hypothetical protein SAMN05421641_10780 [Paracoccus thiocyanatus]
MALLDDINRLLRDHTGYTGDGQGSNGPLPVGDRSTARYTPNMRDLRELMKTIAQTLGDPGALQDILANSGKVFANRAEAVSFGQDRLPAALGRIITLEGNYLVVRGQGQTEDDPLFEIAPRWGVLVRIPNRDLVESISNLGDVLSLQTDTEASTGQLVMATIPAGQAHMTLYAGQQLRFRWPFSNTGPDPVINIDGAEFLIRARNGGELSAGDLPGGQRLLGYVYFNTPETKIIRLSESVRATDINGLKGSLEAGSIIPLVNIGGDGTVITADLAAAAVNAGVTVTGSLSVRYIPAATNANDAETDVTLFVSGDEPRILRSADGTRLPAEFFVVGRAYTLDRRGTIWRVATGSVDRMELNGKADLANSGKTFSSRAAAVALGQENLPSILGPIITQEGNFLVFRGPGQNTDDPLFETAPRWGVIVRAPAGTLLGIGAIPLINISGTGDAIAAELSIPEARISDRTSVEYIPVDTNTGAVKLTIDGDIERDVFSPDGTVLPPGYFKPGRSYTLTRRGASAWRVRSGTVDDRDLATALAAKADLANSGRIFSTRAAAVAAGQAALPGSLGQIFTGAGRALQVRGPGSTNDPLFDTWPYWGIAQVQNTSWAVANAGIPRLNTIASSSGPYLARFSAGVANYISAGDLTDNSKVEFIPNRDSPAAPSILIEGDTERSIFSSTGQILPQGAMKAGKAYLLTRRGEFWRLLVDDSSDVPPDVATRLTALEAGLPAERLAREAADQAEADARQVDVAGLQHEVSDLRSDVDALVTGVRPVGDWDAASGAFPSDRPDASPVQAGDQWSVTGGGVVDGVNFAPGDLLTALVDGGGATYAGSWSRRVGTATQADQVVTTTPGVSVQNWIDRYVKRTSLEWNLSEYLDDEDYYYAGLANSADQDEARVTAAVQLFHDEFMDWWSTSPGRHGLVRYRPITLAVNDEVFSEYFAQSLWDMSNLFDDSRVEFDCSGVKFQIKNWSARAAVRTSGFWAAEGIVEPVPKAVWRWEQSSSRQLSPQIRGRMYITGEMNPNMDVIGMKTMSLNAANLDRVYINNLCNYGKFTENFFNSTVNEMDILRCGYQPTDFGGDGFMSASVRFSNVGNIIEATEPVFESGHAGLSFALAGAGPARGGLRQVHWSPVDEVLDAHHVRLVKVPAANVTGQVGSFEAIRGSIEAGSALLELSRPISRSLVGRYITVFRCGQQGAPSDFGTLTARVTSHVGDQVILSHAAQLTVHGAAVSVACGLYQGRSSDFMLTNRGQNNDVTYHNLRLVGGEISHSACAILVDNNGVDFGPGSKVHGSPPVANNFGGNFMAIGYDVAETVNLDHCLIEHGGHSPRFGRHVLTGGNIQVDVSGGVAGDFLIGTESAEVYNDIHDNPTVAQFYYSAIRHRGYVADQQLIRYGANGRPGQVLGGASSRSARRNPDALAFPNRVAGNGGPTSQRPSPPFLFEKFFDTDLGVEITWTGSAWVDALGNAV